MGGPLLLDTGNGNGSGYSSSGATTNGNASSSHLGVEGLANGTGGMSSQTSFMSVGSTVVEGVPGLEGKDVVQQVRVI